MKGIITISLIAVFSKIGSALQLRQETQNHEMIGLDSLSPLDVARLNSGDWTAVLPSQIQGAASKLIGGAGSSTPELSTLPTLPTS